MANSDNRISVSVVANVAELAASLQLTEQEFSQVFSKISALARSTGATLKASVANVTAYQETVSSLKAVSTEYTELSRSVAVTAEALRNSKKLNLDTAESTAEFKTKLLDLNTQLRSTRAEYGSLTKQSQELRAAIIASSPTVDFTALDTSLTNLRNLLGTTEQAAVRASAATNAAFLATTGLIASQLPIVASYNAALATGGVVAAINAGKAITSLTELGAVLHGIAKVGGEGVFNANWALTGASSIAQLNTAITALRDNYDLLKTHYVANIAEQQRALATLIIAERRHEKDLVSLTPASIGGKAFGLTTIAETHLALLQLYDDFENINRAGVHSAAAISVAYEKLLHTETKLNLELKATTATLNALGVKPVEATSAEIAHREALIKLLGTQAAEVTSLSKKYVDLASVEAAIATKEKAIVRSPRSDAGIAKKSTTLAEIEQLNLLRNVLLEVDVAKNKIAALNNKEAASVTANTTAELSRLRSINNENVLGLNVQRELLANKARLLAAIKEEVALSSKNVGRQDIVKESGAAKLKEVEVQLFLNSAAYRTFLSTGISSNEQLNQSMAALTEAYRINLAAHPHKGTQTRYTNAYNEAVARLTASFGELTAEERRSLELAAAWNKVGTSPEQYRKNIQALTAQYVLFVGQYGAGSAEVLLLDKQIEASVHALINLYKQLDPAIKQWGNTAAKTESEVLERTAALRDMLVRVSSGLSSSEIVVATKIIEKAISDIRAPAEAVIKTFSDWSIVGVRSVQAIAVDINNLKDAASRLQASGIVPRDAAAVAEAVRNRVEALHAEIDSVSRATNNWGIITVRTDAIIIAEINKIKAAYSELQLSGTLSFNEQQRAAAAAAAQLRALHAELVNTEQRVASFGRAWQLIGTYVSFMSIKRLETDIINTEVAAQRAKNAFLGITGSAKEAAQQFEYIRNFADETGLSVNETAKGYVKWTAAIKDTVLEGQKGNAVFEKFSKVFEVLGMSSSESSHAFLALTQMMSKGVVQSEELRKQLGNAVPGAFQQAAKAMRMTTYEFERLLKSGGLISSELLPKLADQLVSSFLGPAASEADKTRKSLMQLSNAYENLKLAFAEGVVEDVGFAKQSSFISAVTEAVLTLRNALKEGGKISDEVRKLGDAAANFVRFSTAVIENADKAVPVIQAFVAALLTVVTATKLITLGSLATSTAIATASSALLAGSGALSGFSVAAAATARAFLAFSRFPIVAAAIGLLTHPLGIVTLALGAAALAWSYFSDSAETAAEKAEKSVHRIAATVADLTKSIELSQTKIGENTSTLLTSVGKLEKHLTELLSKEEAQYTALLQKLDKIRGEQLKLGENYTKSLLTELAVREKEIINRNAVMQNTLAVSFAKNLISEQTYMREKTAAIIRQSAEILNIQAEQQGLSYDLHAAQYRREINDAQRTGKAIEGLTVAKLNSDIDYVTQRQGLYEKSIAYLLQEEHRLGDEIKKTQDKIRDNEEKSTERKRALLDAANSSERAYYWRQHDMFFALDKADLAIRQGKYDAAIKEAAIAEKLSKTMQMSAFERYDIEESISRLTDRALKQKLAAEEQAATEVKRAREEQEASYFALTQSLKQLTSMFKNKLEIKMQVDQTGIAALYSAIDNSRDRVANLKKSLEDAVAVLKELNNLPFNVQTKTIDVGPAVQKIGEMLAKLETIKITLPELDAEKFQKEVDTVIGKIAEIQKNAASIAQEEMKKAAIAMATLRVPIAAADMQTQVLVQTTYRLADAYKELAAQALGAMSVLRQLPSQGVTEPALRMKQPIVYNSGGEVRGFALGGSVFPAMGSGIVPGVGSSDTVPRSLANGSFVLRKAVAEQLYLTQAATRGYAAGGMVRTMLTPGERVFSPSDVNSIGLRTLNRLNSLQIPDIQYHAQGGSVTQGPVQRFDISFGGRRVSRNTDAASQLQGLLRELNIHAAGAI